MKFQDYILQYESDLNPIAAKRAAERFRSDRSLGMDQGLPAKDLWKRSYRDEKHAQRTFQRLDQENAQLTQQNIVNLLNTPDGWAKFSKIMERMPELRYELLKFINS